MDPERWKRIDEIFHAVLDHEPSVRVEFLAEACKEDDSLRIELERLIACHEKESNLFDRPPSDVAAALLAKQDAYSETIAHYRILRKIGRGGMGEVYLAEDTRLNRKVALKILPSEFTQNKDRVRRFEREARAVSGLNHPNILTIYDIGQFDSTSFIASEFIDGETLRQRMSKSKLSLKEILTIGIQTVEALDAAHQAGVIHRDIKLENIMLRNDGYVKVLDFGIAKLTETASGSKVSPLESTKTQAGIVIGTVRYMSPEQARGLKLDARSDIFSLGIVLYELIAVRPPFEGATSSDIIAAILEKHPPALRAYGDFPNELQWIITKALTKDPEERYQTAKDLAADLKRIRKQIEVDEELKRSGPAGFALPGPKTRRTVAIAASILLMLATLIFLFASRNKQTASIPLNLLSLQRLSILLPENTVLNSSAISPDGKHMAYVVNRTTGFSTLWLRSMDSTQAQEISETEGATLPFWSPDSRSIAFFTESELKKWTIDGGPPETLCNVEIPKGGTWNQFGDILFSPKGAGGAGLYRISERGGEATPVTALDRTHAEISHLFPQFLPDGHHFIYLERSPRAKSANVYIASMNSKERKPILHELTPVRFIEPGYLLFVRNDKLMIQHFDKDRFELIGDALPIAGNLSDTLSGPNFSVSQNNILVYGNFEDWASQPIWFDRSGNESSPAAGYPSAVGKPGEYDFCDLSRDDKRLLIVMNGVVWMVDLLKGSFVRYAMTNESGAIFSPNGRQVVYGAFVSDPQPGFNLYARASNGLGKEEILYHSDYSMRSVDWSPDGKYITFTSLAVPETHSLDLFALPLNGKRKAFRYLQTEAREENAVLSPDGKWVAYQSYHSGQSEIYVRSFPIEAGGVWAISTDGGESPIWRRDGKELFYLTLDKRLMAVEVQTGEIFKLGATKFLFQTHTHPRINTRGIASPNHYFASSDGTHFLVNTLIDKTSPTEINVVVNWNLLLKK